MVPMFWGALPMKHISPSKHLDCWQQTWKHFINYVPRFCYYHVAEFQLP
jgi:hypothetical protein